MIFSCMINFNILLYLLVLDITYSPCSNSPCGTNAVCKEQNGVGACTCLPEYFGNPYIHCKPECVLNSDCDHKRSCVNMKCVDPCENLCGLNTECRVTNHRPVCSCLDNHFGNPLDMCIFSERKNTSFNVLCCFLI